MISIEGLEVPFLVDLWSIPLATGVLIFLLKLRSAVFNLLRSLLIGRHQTLLLNYGHVAFDDRIFWLGFWW